jgi:hypothetical protein
LTSWTKRWVRVKIGLIDRDSKIPNLALMKLSTYHKALGNTVALNDFTADKLYCSVIFERNRKEAEKLKHRVILGGTGWDLSTKLPSEIHNCKPDFYLPETDTYIECKGWYDPKSKTRMKRMAKYFPDIKVHIIDWHEYKAIEKTVSMLIPEWEWPKKEGDG